MWITDVCRDGGRIGGGLGMEELGRCFFYLVGECVTLLFSNWRGGGVLDGGGRVDGRGLAGQCMGSGEIDDYM